MECENCEEAMSLLRSFRLVSEAYFDSISKVLQDAHEDCDIAEVKTFDGDHIAWIDLNEH